MSSHGPNLSTVPIDDPATAERLARNPEAQEQIAAGGLATIDQATVVEVAAPTGITFLRSTTTTKVDRERDGDTRTDVKHLARFAVVPGTVPDLRPWANSKHVFRPEWLEVQWSNGLRDTIRITGPKLLKNGLSKLSSTRDWSYWKNRVSDPVPDAVEAAVTAYELAVCTASGKARASK